MEVHDGHCSRWKMSPPCSLNVRVHSFLEHILSEYTVVTEIVTRERLSDI